MNMGAQTFQTSKSNYNILGARRMIGSKFHTKYPQVLGATVQTLVTQVTRHLGFVHSPSWVCWCLDGYYT